jgi:hypothetical protein
MVEGLFFPVKGRGLGLGVALGLSSTYGGRAKQGERDDAGDPARPGVGFGLGARVRLLAGAAVQPRDLGARGRQRGRLRAARVGDAGARVLLV